MLYHDIQIKKILKGCTIKLNRITLNVVDTYMDTYKYLGHYITEDLSDDVY